MPDKAVFIDRDGVINPDPGYIKSPDQIAPYQFTAKALSIFHKLGYRNIIVTNQSGIARGYLTVKELDAIHQKLRNLIEQDGGRIDRIYFAPYHKDGIVAPYNIDHEDRKPGIGMFKKACKDFNLDPAKCWMIGDRYSDMKFAHKAGIKSILVLTGDGKNDYLNKLRNDDIITPTFVVQDILAAALVIKKLSK